MKTLGQKLFICFICVILIGCSEEQTNEPKVEKLKEGDYRAPQAATTPVINCKGDEDCWAKADWESIDKLWMDANYTNADFTSRYKAVWSKEKFYPFVAITNYVLIDSPPDLLNSYWEDDYLEIFIDAGVFGTMELVN